MTVTNLHHQRSVRIDQPPDAALVDVVLAGDIDAFAILVTRYRDRLGRFAYHLLGNREDAEDALQDAFTRAFRSLHRCGDPNRFRAWLFRILVNRCRTAGTRRQRRERTFVAGDRVAEPIQEHPAEQLAWRDAIARALAQLEPEQREAFLLKYVEELSYEEMEQITGIGVSALKMRVKRACGRLRPMLEDSAHA